MRRLAVPVLVLSVVAACSSADPTPAQKTDPPKPATRTFKALEPLASAKTTLDVTFTPKIARRLSSAGQNPVKPDALDGYLKEGAGDQTTLPGVPHATRVIDASTPPAAGPKAKRLTRFVHVPDFQIADDESPTRLARFDTSEGTDAAARPQDAYQCRVLNATVRTVNALHKKDPIDFVLLGGDNADSAQQNEVEWVLGILGGAASVQCDSGDDTDMIAGPDNDGKDPFKPEGLLMKWLWVTGNHDMLVQGNVKVDEGTKLKAVGNTTAGGTRNYSTDKRGPIESGDFIVPDPKRALLDRKALMAKIAADGDGHGVGAKQKELGKAIYTHDVAGTPIRFLVLDTGTETGGDAGIIRRGDLDGVIKPLLDQAKTEGKWVILASHHAVGSLTLDGGALGSKQADAVPPDEWVEVVGAYPNVIFSMVGHTHQHKVAPVTPKAGHAWWEVMTSAIADYPHQFRTIEVFDQDNGWIMMRARCVDYATDGDPVAAEGKRRGVIDFVSGWLPDNGPGADKDRNVELWIKKP